mgnify:FL=1
MNLISFIFTFILLLSTSAQFHVQYTPDNFTEKEHKKAQDWVDEEYLSLSEDERLGQLFIVALYTNKGASHISSVRNLVDSEKIGGLILMQDNAEQLITLVNEFQKKSKIPLLIGMDAEWGIFQRIATAHKFPWAITLGAIQDKNLISELSAKIAEDATRMGIHWNFAPVVDVNTNPKNPIIGNRSFGSEVDNVVASAFAYTQGLQKNGILAAIKHFPGHGDTDVDSHLDLPVISHSKKRLESVELAPFKTMMSKGIGGVMIAHLYVPALENEKGIPASISKNIITGLLKEKYGYKGLIITDALNMGAVAKRYQPGELDALAFKAGNDIMLFSDGVKEGKRLIKEAIAKGEISQKRLEESVKKILMTKYVLGLSEYQPVNPQNIVRDLNNESHKKLSEKMYANALTALCNKNDLLPFSSQEPFYYIPLEEAPYHTFYDKLKSKSGVILKKPTEIGTIPNNSKIIIGFHKDNSTAYKPYKISSESKKILSQVSKNHKVVLTVFGSPYGLADVDISGISSVLVAYENNDDAMNAAADAILGETKIHGRLPVSVNNSLKAGAGVDIKPLRKEKK